MGKYFYGFLGLLFLSFSIYAQQQPKVISLSPDITQIIFALKKENCLVGRSSACGYINGAASIPVAGDMGSPNLEEIMLIKPDILIASAMKDRSSSIIIRNLGIDVYILPADTLNEYYGTVAKLGDLLGAQKEASEEISRIKTGLEKFKKKHAGMPYEKRPSVFIEIWDSPIMTAGHKSFLDDFIRYAGGRNIATGVNSNYFQTTKEWVISQNPQAIIAPFMSDKTKEILKDLPGWSSVSAVKNGKVYNNFDLNEIYTVGPHLLQIIEQFEKCFAPEK